LLLRVVENATDDTWRNARYEPRPDAPDHPATGDGHVAQRSATTAGQKTILTGRHNGCSNTTLIATSGVSAVQRLYSADRVLIICGSPA